MNSLRNPFESLCTLPARVIVALSVVVLLGAGTAAPARAIDNSTGWNCGLCWPGYIAALSTCDLNCGWGCYAHCVRVCQAALLTCLDNFNCWGTTGGWVALFPENARATGNPLFVATPSEIQSGKDISIGWYTPGDWDELASVPASVSSVEFHAVTLAEFDSSLAADSLLSSVPFTYIGAGSPDSTSMNLFSLTLPDIFAPDTPYVVAAVVHDSAVTPDSVQVAFVPLIVSAAAPVGVAELPRPAAGVSVASFPNPSKGSVRIEYQIPQTSPVSLEVYDVTGRLVRTLARSSSQAAGDHVSTWDGRDDRGHPARSGIYFLRLDAGGVRETHRMLRLQ
jgi:FlgD Ig-like domain